MPSGNRRRPVRSGFTLIELLVVIGIILVLLGILLPVANKIIAAGHKADTSAQIAKLATAIQFYFTTNSAYPGPIPESSIWGYNTNGTSAPTSPTANNAVYDASTSKVMPDITSSQNLVLGLIGGLNYVAANLPNTTFDVNQIINGNGPRGLNPLTPQQFPPYIDFVKSELSQDQATGSFVSWAQSNPQTGVGAVLDVPEFMDHFPNPHPIIYLRARVGAGNIADVVINATAAPTGSPWYSLEMNPYWINYTATGLLKPNPNTANAPFPSTPVGSLPAGWTTGQATGLLPMWPTAISFFQNQTLKDNITPRSNGSFILISAGADGIFGTQDDIIYSN